MKIHMLRLGLIALLTLGLCLTVAGMAAAQTADGETPAEEDVCDGESGAAYGLCNAYCEAMDCHLDEPNASAKACEKVGSKFEQITGRRPPCDLFCPCFTAEELQQGTIAQCGDIPGFDDLAGIVYADGRRACSGILCGVAPPARSCAIIRPSGELVIEIIDEDTDLSCRALIFESCPNLTGAELAGPESESDLLFIDQ